MDKSKAKKAVKKSESRKQMAEAANMMAIMQATEAGAGIDPEIQSSQIDMQTPTVNPYHAMGSMAPMMYAPGNMLPGYNFPVMVNPET
jgi:K+-transporting ATPase c subunit